MGQKLDTMTLAQGNLTNDMFVLKFKQLAVFLRSCIISSIYQTLFYATNAFFWNFRKHGLANTHMPPRTMSLDRLLAFPFNGILPSATLWLVPLQQASTVWRLLPPVVRWYPAGEDKTNSYKPDYSCRSYKPIVDPEVLYGRLLVCNNRYTNSYKPYKTNTDVDVLTLACWGFPLRFAPRFQAREEPGEWLQ